MGRTDTETPTRIEAVTAAAHVRIPPGSTEHTWCSVISVSDRSRNARVAARCASRGTTAMSMGSGERCGRDMPNEIASLRAIRLVSQIGGTPGRAHQPLDIDAPVRSAYVGHVGG